MMQTYFWVVKLQLQREHITKAVCLHITKAVSLNEEHKFTASIQQAFVSFLPFGKI